MNSRERVLATLKHEIPDRTPTHVMHIDEEPEYLKALGLKTQDELYDFLGLDIRQIIYRLTDPSEGAEGSVSVMAPLGISGGETDYSAEGEGKWPRPFAKFTTVKEVEQYPWPDVDRWDVSHAQDLIDRYHGKYAIKAGQWFPILDALFDFFGMEKAMFQMYDNPAIIEATVAHLEDLYLRLHKRLLDSIGDKADIYDLGDDFASKDSLLISPEFWRRFIKPSYRKIFDLVKSYDVYLWFHCCGNFNEILPEMIDMGMDVWEATQAHLRGNEAEFIKKEYGQDITFFGAINTQATLPFGSAEAVREEVRERIKVLGQGGGYICGADHFVKPDVPLTNTIALYDEAKRFSCPGSTL